MSTPKMLKILIVEDDRKIAEIQKRFLERIANVELVGIAHTLTDARDLADVLQPQLVLLDVYLPDGHGLDVLREWRAAFQEIDVILITAAKEVDTLRSAMRVGVFEYILKPLVFERLDDAIHRYRAHLEKLENLAHIGQDDVDTLIAKPIATHQTQTPRARLPKGIDALTLEKIQQLMQGAPAQTAEEVGQHIGASRTTARRYLEYLVGEDLLAAEVRYGSVGRPERRYICKT